MSAKVEKSLIEVLSVRGIEWYEFQRVCIAIEVSRKKRKDTSVSKYPPESGRVPLESTRQG